MNNLLNDNLEDDDILDEELEEDFREGLINLRAATRILLIVPFLALGIIKEKYTDSAMVVQEPQIEQPAAPQKNTQVVPAQEQPSEGQPTQETVSEPSSAEPNTPATENTITPESQPSDILTQIIKTPRILRRYFTREKQGAVNDLINFINNNKDERWAKQVIRKIRRDINADRFKVPQSAEGIVTFHQKYLSGVPYLKLAELLAIGGRLY